MKRLVLAASTAVAFAIAGIGASPASATICVYHPTDGTSHACANSYPAVMPCDLDLDGHRVRAWYKNGRNEIPSVWAPSGRCITQIDLVYWPEWIRVCTEEEGCSAWKQHV